MDFLRNKANEKVSDKIKKEIILCHFDEMIKHYKNQGIVIFRKHLHQYSKGYDGASEFRNEINQINDENLMREKIEQFFN